MDLKTPKSVDLSECRLKWVFFCRKYIQKTPTFFAPFGRFLIHYLLRITIFFLPPDDLDPRVLLSILRRVCQSILAKRNRSSLHRENHDTQFDRLNQTSNVYAAVWSITLHRQRTLLVLCLTVYRSHNIFFMIFIVAICLVDRLLE